MHVSPLAEPTRTELWNRRIADFVGLAIVTCALMEFCSEILGVRDSLSIVVLTLACASDPVLRLVQDRRSDREPSARRGTEVTAIVATAPWIVLGWLRAVHPSWSVWQSVAVPAAMHYTGCLLAFGVILARPLLERDPADPDAVLYVPPVTLQSQLLIASLLLVSCSVVAVGLTLYWFAATGIQRLVAPLGTVQGLQCELAHVQRMTQ
jgi:hypothetical protein